MLNWSEKKYVLPIYQNFTYIQCILLNLYGCDCHTSIYKTIFWKNISWFKVRLHNRSIISLSERDLVKRVCIIIREGLLCWGFLFPLSFFNTNLRCKHHMNIVMTDRMVVIHPQTSEFFNSPLTKCCFAACFRLGMVLNAEWIETSLETISFLAESYPLWRQENFYEKTCSVLERESPITNIIRLCCKETFLLFLIKSGL